jgi:beta-phosphoglucomutase-like phosphatase (HAD superfamily)
MANTGDIFDMDGRRAETAAMAEKARTTSIEGLRAQYDELMREPASAERAAEEAKLVDNMRELHRAMSTPQAVKDAEAGKTTDDETASETTLQKAVAALESLNNKLPMPALV